MYAIYSDSSYDDTFGHRVLKLRIKGTSLESFG